jgi:uncharacterized membrane protein YhaH (DUF805 family)
MKRANIYEAKNASFQYNDTRIKSDNKLNKKENDFCCLKLLSDGRIGRTQYFLCTMGITIFGLALAGLLSLIPTIGLPLAVIYLVGMLVFNSFLTIQRCHDINASGWLCMTSLVPFLSGFLYFIPGTKGINKYGLQPTACCPEAKVGAITLATIILIGAVVVLSFYEYPVLNELNTDNLIALGN